MTRLLAIFPLGFALFFSATAYECWHDVFFPPYPHMRLLSFGVAWIQTIGAIGCWIVTVKLAAGVAESEPAGSASQKEGKP